MKYCFNCMNEDTRTGMQNCSRWPLLLPTTSSHLDDTGGSPHANKVLPLQDGPEAALQRDDSPQDFLVEEGLKTLTLRLSQEHLRHAGTFKYSKHSAAVQQIRWHTKGNRWTGFQNPYHRVAHLIPSRWQVDPSEKLPDTWLGRARSSRQQHVEVSHKVLQHGVCVINKDFMVVGNY